MIHAPLLRRITTTLYAVYAAYCAAFCLLLPLCAHGELRAASTLEKLRSARVTVYVFLADACPICQKYAPTLRALSEQYADNAQFIGVFPDPFTTDADVAAFASKFPCGFELQRDSAQQLTRWLKARITPEVVIVSASAEGTTLYRGRIDNQFPELGKRRNIVTEHNLGDALRAIVSGAPVRVPATTAVGCTIERYASSERSLNSKK